MSAFVLVIGIILAVSLHELGHAFAMRRHGVSIEEITIFGLGPKLFKFRLPRYFGNTPILIRALPVGAYVLPSQKGIEVMEGLPYLARSEINGGGVMANVALAVVLFGTLACINGFSENELFRGCSLLVVAILIAREIMVFGKWLCVLLPIPGVALLFLIIQDVIGGGTKPIDAVGGPIAVYNLFAGMVVAHPMVYDGLKMGMLFSIMLGMTNLLPLLPLDGGHLVIDLIRKVVGEARYQRIKIAVSASLLVPGALMIILAIFSDLWHLIF